MAGKLGMLFGSAGHEGMSGYAHGREKLKRFGRNAQGNARAGTPIYLANSCTCRKASISKIYQN